MSISRMQVSIETLNAWRKALAISSNTLKKTKLRQNELRDHFLRSSENDLTSLNHNTVNDLLLCPKNNSTIPRDVRSERVQEQSHR